MKSGVSSIYTSNDLNQYTHVRVAGNSQPAIFPEYDADGNLASQGIAADMNCDGVVSVGDIGPFVLALTNPAGYAAQFPGCDINHADMNQDSVISVGDIGGFVQALTGG